MVASEVDLLADVLRVTSSRLDASGGFNANQSYNNYINCLIF